MPIEYEGKLLQYPSNLKNIIKDNGGVQEYPETLFTRVMFDNSDLRSKRSWIRLRTEENDRITLTLKRVSSNSIEGVKEWEVEVDSFSSAKELVEEMGFNSRNFQESKRERWSLDGVTIDFDEWPNFPPFVEIEGNSREDVERVMKKLKIPFDTLNFDNIDILYKNIGVDIYDIDQLKFDD